MRRVLADNALAGLCAIVLGVLVTAIAVVRPAAPWSDPYRFRAVVTSAETLAKGAPVRIAGVNVGKVERVERGPGPLNTITFTVRDSARPIHRDAQIKLRPRLLLEGNLFVDLRPGTPGGGELPDGGTIPVSQTAVPVRLDEVLSVLRADTRSQLRAALDEYATALDGGGAEAIRRTLPSWRGAFASTAVVADALQGRRDGDLAGWMREQGRAADAVAARERELANLVTGLRVTMGTLAERRLELSSTVRGLARTARVAPPAADELRRALPELRAFVRELRAPLRRAPATLDVAEPFVERLGRLLRPARLPGLARDLRPAAERLADIEPMLVGLFGRVRPVSECVRTHVLPILESKLDDGHLSTGLPVWRELLHTAPGLTSASQNFDGNGPMLRYVLGVGDSTVSVGSLPGGGELFARANKPLLGSRPPAPPRIPPYRPDVACETQRLPELRADAVPPPSSAPTRTRSRSAVERRLLARLLRTTPRAPAERAGGPGR